MKLKVSYKKRLGWPNKEKRNPLVEAGGDFWLTKNGIIIMVPDQIQQGANMFKTLPNNIKVVRWKTNEVIYLT